MMGNTAKEKEGRAIEKSFNRHGNVKREEVGVSVQLNVKEMILFVISEDGTAVAVKLSRDETFKLNNLMGMTTCS